MPSVIVNLLVKVAELVFPWVLNRLENKYPGIKAVVDEIKRILGGNDATVATPNQLVDHLRKF